MKILLAIVFVLALNLCKGQAVLKGDTLTYLTYKFTEKDTVNLFYGSDPKKDFVFVFMGSGMTGVTPLKSGWAKASFIVDKIYKTQGKYYMRGKVLNAPGVNALGSNKIFVDVEGAIDFKELKLE